MSTKTPGKLAKYAPPREEPTSKADEFPNISTFNRTDMQTAKRLLIADVEYGDMLAEINEQRADGRAKLAKIAEKYELAGSGMRWGTYALYYHGMRTRRTLDKRLLLENGVTVEQLKDSYKEGKPYADLKIVDLSKPRAQSKSSDDEA